MSALTQRVFLMRNVHDDAPVLFQSRWALSYLRGPLTGPEISRLMASRKTRSCGRAAACRPASSASQVCSCKRRASATITDVGSATAMAASRGRRRLRGPSRPQESPSTSCPPTGGARRRPLQTHDHGPRQAALHRRETRARSVAHERVSRAALGRRLGSALERSESQRGSQSAPHAQSRRQRHLRIAPGAGDARRALTQPGAKR